MAQHGKHQIEQHQQLMPLPDMEKHSAFMREALNMAELALKNDETPVGCVMVRDGRIVARGMNDTNRSRNGTAHAEFVALAALAQDYPPNSNKHIEALRECELYVTVEPCIMCASMLRQCRIKAVYFGCWNERFGGCGGVLNLHTGEGVDPEYPAYGGIHREEAIMLLRRFYVQENDKAPEPHRKKNRELKTEILPVKVPDKAPAKITTNPRAEGGIALTTGIGTLSLKNKENQPLSKN